MIGSFTLSTLSLLVNMRNKMSHVNLNADSSVAFVKYITCVRRHRRPLQSVASSQTGTLCHRTVAPRPCPQSRCPLSYLLSL